MKLPVKYLCPDCSSPIEHTICNVWNSDAGRATRTQCKRRRRRCRRKPIRTICRAWLRCCIAQNTLFVYCKGYQSARIRVLFRVSERAKLECDISTQIHTQKLPVIRPRPSSSVVVVVFSACSPYFLCFSLLHSCSAPATTGIDWFSVLCESVFVFSVSLPRQHAASGWQTSSWDNGAYISPHALYMCT